MLQQILRLIPNVFVLFLGMMILLAYWTEEIGSARGTFSFHSLSQYGIWLIFFFYGIGMSFADFWKGLSNWRLHLLVHLSTFLIFPFFVLTAYEFFVTDSSRVLWLGIFYVAALPSTVSSSVVMVSLARGNVPAAIFNASLSSLLGVLLTPLWMGLFLTTNRHDFDLLSSVRGLMFIIVLPLMLGMFCYPMLGNWLKRNKKYLRYFDQSIVLMIVYTSFCDSFAAHAFENLKIGTFILLIGGMIVLFFSVYGLMTCLCRFFQFNREDTIAILFCGSKKSLMHGTAMAPVLFAGMNSLGVVLLPIMLYHAFQLFIVSILAHRFTQIRSQPIK